MSALIVPKLAGARRRGIETLPRTPDRPIANRYRSNSSASPSTPDSVFDGDTATQSPSSPLTPFASPSGGSYGFQTPSLAQRDNTFGDETLLAIEERHTRARKSSNAFQTSAAHKKNHRTRKSESSLPTLKLPRDAPPDHRAEASSIVSNPTGGHSTKPIARPRLTRETHLPIIKSYHSDEDSTDDSETQLPLDTGRGRTNDSSGIVAIDGEAESTHSTYVTPEQDQAARESLDAEHENPDLSVVKDKQNKPKTHHLKFSQYGKKKTTHTYNSDICRYILDKRGKNLTRKAAGETESKSKDPPQPGCVYIFKCPDHAPSHVKIGLTKNDPSSRLKTIERECDIDLDIVEQKHEGFFLHYRYLERIVHLALHPERRKYQCNNCKKDDERIHEEWFEISNEKALEEVKLWRDWILVEKPFHKDGTLTDYWYWRAKKLSVSYHKVCWRDWTRPVGIHRLDYVDYMIEMWQGDYWIRLKNHMVRKDIWFCQMGTIFSLLVCMKFGCWGMFLAFVALCIL